MPRVGAYVSLHSGRSRSLCLRRTHKSIAAVFYHKWKTMGKHTRNPAIYMILNVHINWMMISLIFAVDSVLSRAVALILAIAYTICLKYPVY